MRQELQRIMEEAAEVKRKLEHELEEDKLKVSEGLIR
jgi:hypothetical protein